MLVGLVARSYGMMQGKLILSTFFPDDDADGDVESASTHLKAPYFVKPGNMRPNQIKPAANVLQLKCQAAGSYSPLTPRPSSLYRKVYRLVEY